MNHKEYKVFVSSTYEDLKEYRKNISDAILKDGFYPICMENFTASNESQWKTIQPLIEKSDCYILILGFKYGSINKESIISYTHKEYNYARSINKPILSFLLDESFNLEKDISLESINKFRNSVLEDNRITQICTNKNNLSSDILSALNNEYSIMNKSKRIDSKNTLYNISLPELNKNILLKTYTDYSSYTSMAVKSFKDLFLMISDKIINECKENKIFDIISDNIDDRPHGQKHYMEIENESKIKIRSQFYKCGLITISDKISENQKIEFFWKITNKGKEFMYNA